MNAGNKKNDVAPAAPEDDSLGMQLTLPVLGVILGSNAFKVGGWIFCGWDLWHAKACSAERRRYVRGSIQGLTRSVTRR